MSWFARAIDAAKRNDPAARSTAEIVLTYPGFHALFWHRFSHFFISASALFIGEDQCSILAFPDRC